MTKLIVALRHFAKAPKKGLVVTDAYYPPCSPQNFACRAEDILPFQSQFFGAFARNNSFIL